MSNVEQKMVTAARKRGETNRAWLLERDGRARALDAAAPPASADPLRPRIHITPPFGRLNDPNGLVFHDGHYHAYYQFSPLHPERAVFWRHAVSPNLFDWEDRGTVLAPTDFYDTHGCYSGSAIETPEGNLEFYYTGNVKDEAGNREPYQCRATSTDHGTSLVKDSGNPLIAGSPHGYTAHFRDPDVQQRDGSWMMLLGAQRSDGTGAIVRYDANGGPAAPRDRWRFAGEVVFSDPALADLGYMYECPILLALADEATGERRDVIMFCPQGMPASGGHFANTDNLVYVVGRLDGTRFECQGPIREVDSGFEAYAPQAFSNTAGRVVLVLWLGNPAEDDQPSWPRGWVHALSLPRELSLRDGRLVQRPVREVDERAPLEELSPSADGAGSELTVLADERPFVRVKAVVNLALGEIEVEIRGSRDEAAAAGDEPRVVVSMSASCVTVDRADSLYAPRPVGVRRSVPLGPTSPARPDGERELELVLDGSVMEVFIDGGATAFSGRVFVGDFADVALRARGGATIVSAGAGKIR